MKIKINLIKKIQKLLSSKKNNQKKTLQINKINNNNHNHNNHKFKKTYHLMVRKIFNDCNELV